MSESPKLPQVRIRPATEADANFILNSWLKCYRHSICTRGMDNQLYFTHHHKLIEGLFKKATVLIACNDQDITQIYGYLALERTEGVLVVHFSYVKEKFRKFGIARMLLESCGWKVEDPLFYTHKTTAAEALDKKFKFIFNPYLAYYAYRLA